MNTLTFFIGSYTEYPIPEFGGIGKGIYTVELNTDSGELTILHAEMARNPSYLTLSDNNQYLFCNTELDESEKPKVRAYKIKNDFSLEFVNEQAVEGGYPCHIEKFGNTILVACYATGNILQFPLDADGQLRACKNNCKHTGSSINRERQEGPHAHQVAVHPNKNDIYVCDLGIDTIKAYQFQGNDFEANEKKDIAVSKGGGPRHMVFDKDGSLAYVLNELTGKVAVLKKMADAFEEIGTYSSLPSDYEGKPSASAIRIHPNGRFLYAANRGLEAITVFNIMGNALEVLDYQYTGGNEVREFNITPDGIWLIACHQNSHDTVVYQIGSDGKLSETYRTKEVLSPVCVVFLKQ